MRISSPLRVAAIIVRVNWDVVWGTCFTASPNFQAPGARRTFAASHGLVKGAKRSIVRMGFGLYEIVTFPFPTYKDGFKSPLPIKEKWDVVHGYHDFPRELGFQSVYDYVRSQPY